MVLILAAALVLIPASMDNWETDTGIAPAFIAMGIGFAYLVFVYLAALFLNWIDEWETAVRIAKANSINLVAFLVVFFIMFGVASCITGND